MKDPTRKTPRRQTGDPWTRRQFAASVAAAAGAVSISNSPAVFAAAPAKSEPAQLRRKKVALIVTEVRKYSHATHFLDRLLEGYGWEGEYHQPPLELVGLYVDQFPEGDLARERSARHHVKIYPTIAEALTLGGSKLAVDGVIIIGEHGHYPKNEKGQTLYPRYSFFKQVIKVFEDSGRSVPVFNDKHLSTDYAQAVEMVADSRRLGFAFLAGSSLPVTWRLPEVELPLECPLVESVCACYGGVDSYDFHGIETAQCMSERRIGGETGIRTVRALKGQAVWDEMARRETTRELLVAALTRSHTLSAPPGYTFAPLDFEILRRTGPNTTAYFYEHLDGFKTAMFLLNGATKSVAGPDQKSRDELWWGRSVRDFTYAGRLKTGETLSCKMHLPMPPWQSTLADFFNPLMNHIEHTIWENRTPYPIERTLLTTGMTAAAMESLFRDGPVETPELKVAYRAPAKSQYWRT